MASSPPALAESDPRIARGKLLFDQFGCVSCHTVRGIGGVVGPDLTLVGLNEPDSLHLRAHLVRPDSLLLHSPMPAFPLAERQLDDLVAFLQSLGNDLRHTEAAAPLYVARCGVCHVLAGVGNSYGPDLTTTGRLRNVAYIHSYIEDPTSMNPDAAMPPGTGISHDEVENLARYIVATALAGEREEGNPPPPPPPPE